MTSNVYPPTFLVAFGMGALVWGLVSIYVTYQDPTLLNAVTGIVATLAFTCVMTVMEIFNTPRTKE